MTKPKKPQGCEPRILAAADLTHLNPAQRLSYLGADRFRNRRAFLRELLGAASLTVLPASLVMGCDSDDKDDREGNQDAGTDPGEMGGTSGSTDGRDGEVDADSTVSGKGGEGEETCQIPDIPHDEHSTEFFFDQDRKFRDNDYDPCLYAEMIQPKQGESAVTMDTAIIIRFSEKVLQDSVLVTVTGDGSACSSDSEPNLETLFGNCDNRWISDTEIEVRPKWCDDDGPFMFDPGTEITVTVMDARTSTDAKRMQPIGFKFTLAEGTCDCDAFNMYTECCSTHGTCDCDADSGCVCQSNTCSCQSDSCACQSFYCSCQFEGCPLYRV